ncbi:LysR family transcriptional regulator [Herbaspirillum seropedicae]|uniref:LysR family transcription regulator protein n=1 Tax=Herbaspirillum seropedicae (strain SmR1) TaxID=757424 RepID=D8J0S0_HERSS|nr:LysR family transcriptional regulator [Herbaspirillum seropedicae]ADJ62475.1 LysR family transcription regulator protein [Herbaspirillum seropedicae SmR1]AKN64601.1 LysR family transcriptional regulator [Herbaspirillum seropedicae]NQE30981.1 LysR family transcriptional regulator [Herbaspirillum seropedicae]UMU20535.1 LysR family transcriptional regulator [Herbaspirillum seropedicae]
MGDTLNDHRIAYLYEAVRTGSVRAAADALDIAPSAVSRQISLLEQELAVPLIERHKRGVSPTEAGALLLEYYREQRSHQSDVLAKLQEIRGLKRGSINIIMGEGFISDMVSGPIKQFCKKYPEIALVLDLAGTNEVVSAVAADEAEIGLVFNPPVEAKIVSRAVARQPMYAIVGRQFPLLGKVESVTLRELAGYPMALTHLAYGTRQLVEAATLIEKTRLTPTITTNSIAILKHFVKSELGFTLLPLFAVTTELAARELYAIPVRNALLARSEAHLITRTGRQLSTAANRLLQHLSTRMKAFQD